jgi:hypothetical protein
VASFIATFGGQSSKPVPKGLDDGNTTFLFLALRALRPRRRGGKGIRNRSAPELCAEKALSDQGSTRFAAAVALTALVMPFERPVSPTYLNPVVR